MNKWPRWRILFLAVLGAAGVFMPWGAARTGGTWIALAGWAAGHQLAAGLEAASRLVTIAAAAMALLAAALRVFAQLRGRSQALGIVGLPAVCLPLTLLMPVRGAAVFLSGCVAVLVYDLYDLLRRRRGEASAPARTPGDALLRELFPILFAGVFLGFGWQYNAHLLTRLILVAGGMALIARAAILPSPKEPRTPESSVATPLKSDP